MTADLIAENARLREALMEIIEQDKMPGTLNGKQVFHDGLCGAIARAALAKHGSK